MKEAPFHDIYDYIYIPFWKTTPFLIGVLTLGGILLGITTYLLLKKLRKKKETPVPPWEKAFIALKKLSPKVYTSKEEFKQFYFDITLIFKKYLGNRFDWNLLELTDEELVTHLRNNEPRTKVHGISPRPLPTHPRLKSEGNSGRINTPQEKKLTEENIDKLEEVLQGSLLIKFANAEALKEKAEKDLKTIISLIRRTIPKTKPSIKKP